MLKSEQFLKFFLKFGLERWRIMSLMQNEGKTDKWKSMITFLSDDFSAPSERLICEY